jgi:hypothetical protein
LRRGRDLARSAGSELPTGGLSEGVLGLFVRSRGLACNDTLVVVDGRWGGAAGHLHYADWSLGGGDPQRGSQCEECNVDDQGRHHRSS